MNTVRICLSLLLLSGVFFSLSAQHIILLDEATGIPVENVAVFNKTKDKSLISDKNGRADISIFARDDSIYFQHPSYEDYVFTLNELVASDGPFFLKKRNIMMAEFVISASKNKEKKSDLPYKIDVLESKLLSTTAYQNSADILQETGNIMIQKSQGGGGSPVLRGFEANRILLVVDGIRMNNAIYRSGHLQNSLTIDNSILERVEVLYGPSSVMYGSDALGGVIHYYTSEPLSSGIEIQSNLQYSTVNRGKLFHAHLNAGNEKIGNIISFTFKDFGDIRSGRNRKDGYGDWGLVKNYTGWIDGTDTMLENADPEIQKKTAYSQYDFLNKLRFSPNDKLDLLLNFQHSTSSDVPRFDMLNDYDGDTLKYAEWYYGPQKRTLGALQLKYRKYNSLFTNFSANLFFQKIEEDRISRRFGVSDKLHQEEDVFVYSFSFDFLKILNQDSRLLYGLEYTHNDVLSDAYYININTSLMQPAETRYPDNGSHTNSASLYTNYKRDFQSRYIFNAGLRYNYDHLKSAFMNPVPYENIKISNGALTGSASLVYHPEETWQYNLLLSTGFRNPNVDDYGKIRAKGDYITVPNKDLKPEYTYNFEFGTTKTFKELFSISGTFFNTYLNNAIVRTDFSINGSDSLWYDGQNYRIISNTNASRANISGLSMSISSEMMNNLGFRSTLNILQGKDLSNDVPLGHIPPLFGRTSVDYSQGKFIGEIYVLYSGEKPLSLMSPFGEDNETEALENEGYPAWHTINFRCSYRIGNSLEIQANLENLFDRFYKSFASGVAGYGRNFSFTLRFSL